MAIIDNNKPKATPRVYTHGDMLELLGLSAAGFRNNTTCLSSHMRRYSNSLWAADDVERVAKQLWYYGKTGRRTQLIHCRLPDDDMADIRAASSAAHLTLSSVIRLLAHEGIEVQPRRGVNTSAATGAFSMYVPVSLLRRSMRSASPDDDGALSSDFAASVCAGLAEHGLDNLEERLAGCPLAILTWTYAEVLELPPPPDDVALPHNAIAPLPPVYGALQVGKLLGVDLGNMARAHVYPREIPWLRRYDIAGGSRCVYDASDVRRLVVILDEHRRQNAGVIRWESLADEIRQYRPSGEKTREV